MTATSRARAAYSGISASAARTATYRGRPHKGHNHPSGDPTPSTEDREVTRRLAEAGKLLGITLLDHIVFTAEGEHHSLRETAPELFTA